MKTFAQISVMALAVATLSAGALVIAVAQDLPRGDAANGRRIYLAVGCFTCHGRSGQGGAYNGPAPILARTALPFVGFKALIRDPSNDMPAYSDAVLSDQDIADVYAFLESLPGPRSPRDISILNN
jgi:mono/diheme cytochrome c family protein